ncbi:hypothetical protein DSUL_50216 [Desulfovibrionales bacterium]
MLDGKDCLDSALASVFGVEGLEDLSLSMESVAHRPTMNIPCSSGL